MIMVTFSGMASKINHDHETVRQPYRWTGYPGRCGRIEA